MQAKSFYGTVALATLIGTIIDFSEINPIKALFWSAVVNGVIEQKGVNPLGGNKLWVRSPGDNWSYYYAHLAGYAPGIANGTRVKKGQVIGYVGNTGNARTTPPHLHFETHVPSGAAANPYPILKRVNLIK